MPNKLANESSPYLLQHQNNPVDWYPWGEEALQRAKDENKPIFLSIGYSACHWCHVMEHESFEDESIADMLNAKFINIKVDREERPDLDQIYMNAVQILTGHGGWPMSVFLTPELKPFFGGTYWPPRQRGQMPGFSQIIEGVDRAWINRNDQALAYAEELTAKLQRVGFGELEEDEQQPSNDYIDAALVALENHFDFQHGGFGTAPKFPNAMNLELMLRSWTRTGNQTLLDMVRLNLDKMALGGIYDHLGGGFSRYSVDARWLVPHFEKMLYDNGQLVDIYLHAYQVTGNPLYEQTVRDTCDYILHTMTDSQHGCFFSTEDADSEGEEGKFYVWSKSEVLEVLEDLGREQSEEFCRIYDITEQGNFEGHNIPNLAKPLNSSQDFTAAKQRLFEHRAQRIRPGLDDKVLVSWNALMIQSMAQAGVIFKQSRYLQAAIRASEFILEYMTTDSSDDSVRLLHSWRNGKAKLNAYLDDYSYLANAYTTLYECTADGKWLDQAVALVDTTLKHFLDPDNSGFFFTSDDHEQLITRNKDSFDSSVPSGNSMMAYVLVRLGKLCNNTEWLEIAEQTIQNSAAVLQRAPNGCGQMLLALDLLLNDTQEVVIATDQQTDREELQQFLYSGFIPRRTIAYINPADSKSTANSLRQQAMTRKLIDNQTTVYVCCNFSCEKPLSNRGEIESALDTMKVSFS
ncbi:MAG: thioredoxin domain-containing protein [Planctomycetaceae bacterium]|nr:thioredoxin domain-containing protein [Planctomycetaceae bacterium]|tara:strand:- start:561 stop:2627 length:2067 start_codon:yes stop_codon:yes gene_type:complete